MTLIEKGGKAPKKWFIVLAMIYNLIAASIGCLACLAIIIDIL